ncbi:MAG: hypothetical protein WCK51_14775 [Armatimonadota bacterium]
MLVPELQLILDAFESRVRTGKLTVETPSAERLLLVPQVPDSFPISITFAGPEDIVVAVEPWHEHMSSVQLASSLAIWLLTPYYRIVVAYAAGQPIEAHAEVFQDHGWVSRREVTLVDSEAELPVPDEIRIRHQAVFLDSNYARYYPQAELDQAGCPAGTLLGETIYHLLNGEWHPTNVPEMPE